MSISIKTKYWLIGILILILGIFFSGWHLGRAKANNAHKAIENALSEEIRRYVVEINHQKLYITEKEQEVETLRQAKKDGEITNEELRKLNIRYVNELTRLKLVIDTMLANVPHDGQIVVIHDTLNNKQNCLLLPFTFSKKDRWMALAGTFGNEAKLDITLKINTSLDIWAVQKKRKDTPSVVVTTDNPYLSVIGVKSIKLDVPKEKRFGIGVSAGYGITSAFQASPFLGVGLNYNVIRF